MEVLAGAFEAYLDELTIFGLESWEWLNGLDTVLVVVVHTAGVTMFF